ncbi:uncharacterized protein IWZ02DRAFT_462428, partial [Phyllosticta citriasiana]|uniref:uncharacterized protein n=1 Tax=Phyllosticta citriasiana TaxID=595635 RepID=UPI0030FDF53B
MPQSPASSVAGWERLSHADASSDWDELSMTPPGENDSCASGSVKGGEDDEDVEDVCSDLDDVSSDDAGGEDVNSEDAGSDDASHDDDDDDNGEDEQSESASSSGLPELCDLSAESEDEVPPTTVQKEPKHRDIKPIEVVELSPIQEKEDDDSAVEHIEDIRAVSDEIRDIVAAMRSPRYMHDNIMRHARPAPFNYQHVGVFVPDATGFGTNTVSLRDGVNCYRDVEYFIDAAGAAQAIMSPKVLRENLHSCLSGAAHTWYTTELSPWEHHWATMGEGLAHWITLLRKRWGPTDAQAVRRFCNFKVTLVDTRMDRRRFVSVDGRWYVMKAVHICRQVGIDNTYGQLVWAYSRLTPQLQAMVQPPRRDESIDSFARRLFVVNFLVMARES